MTKAPDDTFNIVRAGVEQVELLVPVFNAYRAFYGQTDTKGSRRFLMARLTRSQSVCFIAVRNRTDVLGFVQLYPMFSSVRLSSMWILNDLFVVPSARKEGVGSALLEEAEKHARESEASHLELATHVTNESAQSLYRARGWKRDDAFLRYEKQIASDGSDAEF